MEKDYTKLRILLRFLKEHYAYSAFLNALAYSKRSYGVTYSQALIQLDKVLLDRTEESLNYTINWERSGNPNLWINLDAIWRKKSIPLLMKLSQEQKEIWINRLH